MHPLKQLQRLLTPRVSNHGKVIGIEGDLRVVTTQGVLTIPRRASDATQYRVGDSVILANGQLVGKRLAEPPVYVL